MNYISLSCAQKIHQLTIKYSGGGAYEYLDLGRLDSVLTNIQNDDYYPTFVDKLTHLFYCSCKFHCFADGNKRIALSLSAHFLLINGYTDVAKRFLRMTENVTYHVAAGRIDKELLHRILSAIMTDTYETDEQLKFDLLHAISE
ncbi:MAG: type II toxin-antitoxin system death-on-curing family toxin [Clostridia bacterium]|nr:type II toxin-antitoxin system death-on-curing family toxin [Clostridia bacterium]